MKQLKDLRNKPRSERVAKLFDFHAFEYQQDILDIDESVIQVAVKPGRQVGKTLTGGAIGADAALRGRDVMILGPFEEVVHEMMDAAKNHLQTAKRTLESAGYKLGEVDTKVLEWTFSNGGRIRARTVGSDGSQIRGKNPDVVLVDEAAYIDRDIFTQVIEPFFSTHSNYEFYLFSTPAGKNGYFYDAVEGANSDEWYSPHWPTKINPLVDDEFLEKKKQQTDSITYQQEYLGEFVDEADSFLPYDLVTPCVRDAPEATSEPRYLGVDIARKGKDKTVFIDIDKSGVIRDIQSEETSTVPGVVGRIKNLHSSNQYEAIYVDENAVGGGVVDDEGLQGVVTGITFSTKSKHQMYTDLKTAFEKEELTIPANHDERRELVAELTSLEFSFTANGYLKVGHPKGGHDDYADALALANMAREGMNRTKITRRKGLRGKTGSML